MSEDQDATISDPDQSLSEEQTYRETHIPDLEMSAAASGDNPFATPKTQVPGKVSVQMPTDD